MALMELYGLGYDDFETYTSRLDAIGIEDVKRVARRLLEGQERVSVRVGPQSKEAAAPQLDSVTA
jgi:zinc protease